MDKSQSVVKSVFMNGSAPDREKLLECWIRIVGGALERGIFEADGGETNAQFFPGSDPDGEGSVE